MRKKTSENLTARMRWLGSVISGSVNVSQDQKLMLQDMRTFCAGSVPGGFDAISYNALKQNAIAIPLPESAVAGDGWDYIKQLRAHANSIVTQLTTTPEIESHVDPESLAEMRQRESILLVNLTMMAYLELTEQLIGFMHTHHGELPDRIKIILQRIIETNEIKFRSVSGATTTPPKNTIALIWPKQQ